MQQLYKIIIYIPETHAAKLREAIAKAGAGKLGNYEACSFSAKGTGRYRPLEGAKPFLGKKGEIKEVKEERIEAVAVKENVKAIIKAIRSVHPYEEPAFEIIPLVNHEFEGAKIISGNARTLSKKKKGWFLGHFIEQPLEFKTNHLELGWKSPKKGGKKPESKYNETAYTLTVLIKGRMEILFPLEKKKRITLRKPGDFVYFRPKVCHTWNALKKSEVFTVRWPSIPEDQKLC